MKSRRSKLILIAVLLIAVLGGLIYWFIHRGEESTDDAAIDGRIVMLSPKIAGHIVTFNIVDNQQVKKGDVLLEVDPADYILRRDHAAAVLEAAEAAASASVSNKETTNISAPSNLEAAQAQVASAEANWEKSVSDLHRMQRLSNEARSQEQLDQAVANEKAMRSSLEDARARLRSAETAPKAIAAAEATSRQLAAQVKQAKVDLAQAEQDLSDSQVIAPMDGRITKRSVEFGDYVQPGQQLAALVSNDLWVVANFKETQLTHIRPGQRVTIKVDAFPDLKLDAHVDSIQSGSGAYFSAFPPENATGNFVKIVQRVPVKLVFDNKPDAALVLGPGMSVVPTIYTDGAAKQYPAPSATDKKDDAKQDSGKPDKDAAP
jgi:membrane fusion protein (multidrug efflux system)